MSPTSPVLVGHHLLDWVAEHGALEHAGLYMILVDYGFGPNVDVQFIAHSKAGFDTLAGLIPWTRGGDRWGKYSTAASDGKVWRRAGLAFGVDVIVTFGVAKDEAA